MKKTGASSKHTKNECDEFTLSFEEELSGMTPEEKKRQVESKGWWDSLDKKILEQKTNLSWLPTAPTKEEIDALYKP